VGCSTRLEHGRTGEHERYRDIGTDGWLLSVTVQQEPRAQVKERGGDNAGKTFKIKARDDVWYQQTSRESEEMLDPLFFKRA
jgi:hypothetical protein